MTDSIFEVHADIMLSCTYKIMAKSMLEAKVMVLSGDVKPNEKIEVTDPLITSIKKIGDNNVNE